MKAIDITDMSDRQIEEVIQQGTVELQERRNAEFEDAITHGIQVQEVSPDRQLDYLEWLRGAGSHHPRAWQLLESWDDYWSQEEIKQSRRTTGA